MGDSIQAELEAEIRRSLANGKLPCAEAFRIAKHFKVAPVRVGEAANTMKVKVCACQLGCFP